jgi:hypothetical protein
LQPLTHWSLNQWLYINIILYAGVLPIIKASILILLARLQPPSRFIVSFIWTTFALNAGLFISIALALIFQCRSVQYFYDRSITGICIRSMKLYTFHNSATIFTDILVLILPICITHGLNMPLGKKIAVTAILSLGVL